VATAGQRREERKVITVLFVDLVDFTSRAERMDVEDVRGMLEPYYALVSQELVLSGGVLEKFIGDAVVAVFGAPVAHEDDPERAVRAALAIQEAVAAANAGRPELELHVRIGVNTGEALVWLNARSGSGGPIASGDVVNTAARLQAAGPVDGVVVGEITRRATSDAIDYVELSPVSAKGKSAPVRCWQALQARSRVGERRLHESAIRLIDRRRERAAIVEGFERSRDEGIVRALTLVGAPGIGKTRLVREFADHVDRSPELIRWRRGRSLPYGQSATFAVLSEIVKAEAGVLRSHEPDVAAAKLARAVAAVARDPGEAAWMEEHVGVLIGHDEVPSLFGDRRAEAFAAWRRFLERMAEHRPTVLVFEDIHWADNAAVEFIDDLITWAADCPLYVLCTARPELLDRRPGWGVGTDRSRVVTLLPLSQADTSDLLDALLGNKSMPSELRAALLEGAEGNPLYAQEFIRLLLDRGALVETEAGWALESVDELPVPDTVLGIIAARLDALPAEDKAVIQDASVVGKTFWTGTLAQMAERGVWAVDEALRRLQHRGLIRPRPESTVAGEAEYAFDHALIRDVAYRSILRADRAEKHLGVVEWLHSLAGDRRDHAEAIAHHYVTALENAEASGRDTSDLRRVTADAVREAAARAAAVNAYRVAVDMYRRSLVLGAPDDAHRPEVLLALGKALVMADEPALDVLDEAAQALLAAGNRLGAAQAESTAGWLLSIAGTPELARDRDERALALATDGPPSRALAEILIRAGAHVVFIDERRRDGLQLLREGASIAVELGLPHFEAEALQCVALARLASGDAGGVDDAERALRLARTQNSPVALSCAGNLADIWWDLGRLQEASDLHGYGLEAAGRFGIPIQFRRFRASQAMDCYYRGEWNEAATRIEEYLEAIEAGSPHRAKSDALVIRGRILLARGDADAACEDAVAALEFARGTGEPFTLRPALAFHARAVLMRSPDQAAADVTELLGSIGAGQSIWGTWGLPDALEAVQQLDRLEELRRIIDAATPDSRWYRPVEAICEGDPARAADLYAAMGSLPDEAIARLSSAQALMSAGETASAHEQLERALAFFRKVGAARYVQVADSLVAGAEAT
jgi:class 3 adenylate cyclase/tetratricopeptide (TPR) repeat protein